MVNIPKALGTITDTVTLEYTKDRYIGRTDQVHIYTGVNRNVTFDFKVENLLNKKYQSYKKK